jgi:hypothetical protein
MLANQELCHLNHTSISFHSGYFEDGGESQELFAQVGLEP